MKVVINLVGSSGNHDSGGLGSFPARVEYLFTLQF